MSSTLRNETWLPQRKDQARPQWQSINEAIYRLPEVLETVWQDSLGSVPDHRFTKASDGSYGNKLRTVHEASSTINFAIEDRTPPAAIIDKLLRAIDQSFKPNEPSGITSTETAQWEAYFRECRRCDVVMRQYQCLRALNEYVQTVRSLKDTDQRYPGYFEQFQTAIEEAAKQLITEQATITNPEAFQKIQRVGEPISREANTPITIEQLVYVRAMNDHVPTVQDGACVTTTPFRAGVSNRNSIHGALNHLVEPHSQASWQGAAGITILPLASLVEQHQPTNATEVDTYFFGDVEFTWPDGAIIVVQAGAELWENLLAEHPEIEQRYTVLRVTNPEAMRTATVLAMLRQGYTTIPGGDHQSSDPVIAKKMQAFRETFATHEGGTPHFISAADQLDMAHGTILLQRIKQQQAHPDNWLDEVDWVNDKLARGQLSELVNGARGFWRNVGSADLAAYNLPETRRAELINAIADILKNTPDPHTKYTDITAQLDVVRDDDQLYHRQDVKRLLYLTSRTLYRSYYKLKRDAAPEAQACLERINQLLDVDTHTALNSWTDADEIRAILQP